ncbi:hypothetical protein KKC1_05470 [Calderihabitans maritimus]|uniref:Uncharacterized protein n=1 Tax=Calderihabitans maritimus TaxID=1246530 RepID=A0A1Z5HQ14_9FIRM|nr:hypothetical protein KKC1_05470 [Calderihabitans maritimus]
MWSISNLIPLVLLIVLPVWLIIKINSIDKNIKKLLQKLEK